MIQCSVCSQKATRENRTNSASTCQSVWVIYWLTHSLPMCVGGSSGPVRTWCWREALSVSTRTKKTRDR